MSSIVGPGLIVGLIAGVLSYFVTRQVPEHRRPKEVAVVGRMATGFIFIFAFVLGLTVSQESGTLGQAKMAASTEANSVGELYWYAHAVSDPEHSRLQGLLRDYTNLVVNNEWPLLGSHKESPEARAAARAIRNDILSFHPSTDTEKAVYSSELSQVSSLFIARRTRLDVATSGGVPPILLDGIIALGILIIVVTPFTSTFSDIRLNILYAVFVALLVSIFFLLQDINNPFSGTVTVQPTVFKLLIVRTFPALSSTLASPTPSPTPTPSLASPTPSPSQSPSPSFLIPSPVVIPSPLSVPTSKIHVPKSPAPAPVSVVPEAPAPTSERPPQTPAPIPSASKLCLPLLPCL